MSDTRTPRYGQPNFDYISKMAATAPEDDGPVYMINFMKYREVASYSGGGAGQRSGREADDLYAPTDILRDIGARIVFVSDVERQLFGEPKWDRVAIVRYATRSSFLQMQRRGDFKEKHVHKDAGMEQTIVVAGLPLAVPELPAVEATAPVEGDGPFVMVHLMRFAEGGKAAMAEYEATAGAAGLALGARPVAAFRVEGTIVGDGSSWDEVRFNRFPSHEAFEQLIANPVHRAGQPGRAKALADTHAIMVLPSIDRLAESTRE